MSAYLAEFSDLQRLLAAARRIRTGSDRLLDAHTPFAVPEVNALLEEPGGGARIGVSMLIAGLAVAALAFLLQWYSAVIDYPLNVGGRPLNSWPVFLLAPFEVGMLAAAIAGFVAFLSECGMPRLYDPIFSSPGFERASQDRFFLVVAPAAADRAEQLRQSLLDHGAVAVSEVAS